MSANDNDGSASDADGDGNNVAALASTMDGVFADIDQLPPEQRLKAAKTILPRIWRRVGCGIWCAELCLLNARAGGCCTCACVCTCVPGQTTTAVHRCKHMTGRIWLAWKSMHCICLPYGHSPALATWVAVNSCLTTANCNGLQHTLLMACMCTAAPPGGNSGSQTRCCAPQRAGFPLHHSWCGDHGQVHTWHPCPEELHMRV
jgi:hypothetical protein